MSRVKRVRKPVSGLAGLGHGGHGSASASAPCENERSGIGRGKAASAASYAASSPVADPGFKPRICPAKIFHNQYSV
jgi:hypothetical protein